MKISSFTITTNSIERQYPVIESVKSILPLVDEVIVVDGGSTDGTVEELKKLSDKVIIINEEWENDWVYWRMGKNWARGFDECVKRGADWIIKFDNDYVFQQDYALRGEFTMIQDTVLTVGFQRKNLQLVDRFFEKRPKTLAVNYTLCEKQGRNVRWGYDMVHWGLCDEAIIYEKTEHELLQGTLLSLSSIRHITPIKVFNYGYCFRNEKIGKEIMFRNMRAYWKQLEMMGHKTVKNFTKESIWQSHIENNLKEFNTKHHEKILIGEHPTREIRDKIINLKSDKQGYNFFGKYDTAKYYKK